MGQVTRLYHVEELRLDDRRLRALVANPRDRGAERVVTRAMGEIAVRLARIESAYAIGALDRVGRGAHSVLAIADQTGLASLRDAAAAVTGLAQSRDSAALAACVARLIRVGEMSIVTVSDVHDLSL
jgi:hypothetical protein